ncbi:Gfo/Idh/MocA family protein [Paenibacillus thalictri]|uniref:Gfo/Idh/MocA family oxidoreductase n=1 Tax=Paenibacillus thalictri TaxID=2527873 RepID=A0A4Q9DLT1_9BACL|nr:Gfo/Idh/MocA family oxidoreductase [Paenibacillus thalictri]TBL73952.1 Gfo/Idh/MocA family oxidoreductase [Paenibacillus thalictri]
MTLKIGFVGTGSFSDKHQNIIGKMEGVEVAAICGRSLEKAERAAQRWSDAKAYTSVEDMLNDRKLDAVYISVIPAAHGETELSLIERGIPFFVEKPLGIRAEDLLPVRDKVAEKKLITCVGYHFRYHDSTAKAHELLKERTVGMALGYWMGTTPRVPWWRVQAQSGGQFVEQATHAVDMLRYLCGDVTEVYAAFGHRAMHETVEGLDVADVGTVTMKLASGAVATISNTCLLPSSHHIGLDVYTAEGVLEVRAGSLKDIGKSQTVETKNVSDPYVLENEAFLHAVRTGDTSLIRSDYLDGFRSLQVTSAANESALSGQPVRIG